MKTIKELYEAILEKDTKLRESSKTENDYLLWRGHNECFGEIEKLMMEGQ